MTEKVKVYCDPGCWNKRLNKYKGIIDFYCHYSGEPSPLLYPACDNPRQSFSLYEQNWHGRVVSNKFDDIVRVLPLAHKEDIQYLDAAFQHKADYFLTDDSVILDHREELEKLLEIKIFSPQREMQTIEQEFSCLNHNIDYALKLIQKVIELRDIDSCLLDASQSYYVLNLNAHAFLHEDLLAFYSDNEWIRKNAFNNLIKKRVLHALRIGANIHKGLPKVFLCNSLDNDSLFDHVIRMAFSAEREFQDLIDVLKGIKQAGIAYDSGKEDEKVKLMEEWNDIWNRTILRRFACFESDIRALDELEEVMEEVGNLSGLSFKERLLLISSISRCGECFTKISEEVKKKIGSSAVQRIKDVRNKLCHNGYKILKALYQDSLSKKLELIKEEFIKFAEFVPSILPFFKEVKGQDPKVILAQIESGQIYSEIPEQKKCEMSVLSEFLKNLSHLKEPKENIVEIIDFMRKTLGYEGDYLFEATKVAWARTLLDKERSLDKIIREIDEDELSKRVSAAYNGFFVHGSQAHETENYARKPLCYSEFELQRKSFEGMAGEVRNLLIDQKQQFQEELDSFTDLSRFARSRQITEHLWKNDIHSNLWFHAWHFTENDFSENQIKSCEAIIPFFFETLANFVEESEDKVLSRYIPSFKEIRKFYAHPQNNHFPRLEGGFFDQVASYNDPKFAHFSVNQNHFSNKQRSLIIIGYVLSNIYFILKKF